MPLTSPKTWSVGEKLTAANFNTHIRDNLTWLITRPYSVVSYAATYSSTSASFVDIDATNLTATITLGAAATRCLFGVQMYLTGPSGSGIYGAVDMMVNGARIGDASYGIAMSYANSALFGQFLKTGLTGGSTITFKPQWRTSSAGIAVSNLGMVRIFACEV